MVEHRCITLCSSLLSRLYSDIMSAPVTSRPYGEHTEMRQESTGTNLSSEASISQLQSPGQVVLAEAAILCGVTKKDAIRIATLISALVSCIAAVVVVIMKYV